MASVFSGWLFLTTFFAFFCAGERARGELGLLLKFYGTVQNH